MSIIISVLPFVVMNPIFSYQFVITCNSCMLNGVQAVYQMM